MRGPRARDPEARGRSAAAKVLRAADAQEELERIAAWCRQRVLVQPDVRLLVILAGCAGERASAWRHSFARRWIRAACSDRRGACRDTPVGIEGGQPLAQLPMIAHALTTLEWLAGGRGWILESLSRWLRAAALERSVCRPRARHLDLSLRGARPCPACVCGSSWWGLRLAAPRLQAAARAFTAQLENAAAALGEGQHLARGSGRSASPQRSPRPAGPDPLRRTAPASRTLMRWHELLQEFGELGGSLGSVAPRGGASAW